MRRLFFIVLLLLLVGGGVAWWQRTALLAWYYTGKLAEAGPADREVWVVRVVALDDGALPALLKGLRATEQESCENHGVALLALVEKWGPEDARSIGMVEKIAQDFSGFSVPGKNTALQVPAALLKRHPSDKALAAALTRASGDLLACAEKSAELRVATLLLAGALIERVPAGQWLEQCRRLVEQGLTAAEQKQRVAAIHLALRGPLRQDKELLARLVPLLKDKSAAVRKAALGALGSAREVISEDDLLPLLHDPDDEVQHLCEQALRSRGLQESHILLARLISDERPNARLQVLLHLRQASDLEPGVWLKRLCQDSSPAVRAAAIRAAASQTQTDLTSCLRDLAQQDPSPTVRQLAGHYLSRPLAIREE